MLVRLIIVTFFIAFVAIFLFWPEKVFADVFLNELLPNPSSSLDWIELYNDGDEEVDLEGWFLEDSTSAILTIHETKINSHNFLVIEVSNRLNKDEDTVYLKDQNGEEIDSYGYDYNPGTDISFGRTLAEGEWGVCQQPTPNSENNCLLPSPSPEASPSEEPEEESSPSPEASPFLSSTPSPIPVNVIGATFLGRTLGASQSTSAGFYPWEATEEGESQEATENAKIKSLPKIIFVLGLILLLSAATHFCYNQRK